MAPGGSEPSQGARRALCLNAAIKFRDMAAQAHSPETRQALMQLTVLYEELAEYAATPTCPQPTEVQCPNPSQSSKDRDAD